MDAVYGGFLQRIKIKMVSTTILTTTKYWRQTNLIRSETPSPLRLWPHPDSHTSEQKI
jgi:hypothetical protein